MKSPVLSCLLLVVAALASAPAGTAPIPLQNPSFEANRNPTSNGAFGSGDLTDLSLISPSGWSVIATDNTGAATDGAEIAFGWLNITPADPAPGSPAPQVLSLMAGAAIGQTTTTPWASLAAGDLLTVRVAAGDRNVNAPTGTPRWADDSFFGLSQGLATRNTPTPGGASSGWLGNVVASSTVTTPPTGYKAGTMADVVLTYTVTAADVARPGNVGVFIASVGDRDGTGTGTGVTTRQSFWDHLRLEVTTARPGITTFTASPALIGGGGSAVLSWAVTDATSVSIDNGIGTVPASGSRSVSPGATTTYTLTATGPGGSSVGSVQVLVADGLQARTFDTLEGDSLLQPIANLLAATPSATFLQVDDIDYQDDFVGALPGLTGADSFAVLWTGWFDASLEGTGDYTFGTESDDGSVIYLDLNDDGDFGDPGELVVSNLGNHPMQTVTATANLAQEAVAIAIGFYESGGGEGMRARFRKGTGLSFSSLDPINGLTGHFVPSAPANGAPVVTLTASPGAIRAGQSATLSWTVVNATNVTLDPGLGARPLSGSVVVTPSATTTYTLTATGAGGSRTKTAAVTLVPEGAFRYYRFAPTALRDNSAANSVQLAEFQVFSGATRLAGASASNPGGNSPGGEGPAQANDNNLSSKWLDFTKFTPLVLDFGGPVDADRYRIATANDSDERDPISWTVDGSNDGVNWLRLDARTGFATPTARETYTDFLLFADAGGPRVNSLTATPAIIDPGGSVTLAWTSTNAVSATLSGVGSVPLNGSQVVAPAATTNYTVEVTAADGRKASRQVTVTVRTPGTFVYRYYSFVPTAFRGVDDSVQLSEFEVQLGGVRLAGATASNPGGNSPGGEGPAQANDGDVNSKWLDFNKSRLVLDFGAPVAADGYTWATANDGEGRDPVSWRVEGSQDQVHWVPLHIVTDYATPTARNTYLPGFPFEDGLTLPLVIRTFRVSPVVVSNTAQPVTLTWDVEGASGGLAITGVAGPAASGSALPTLVDGLNTFTLRATGAASVVQATVRVLVGAPRGLAQRYYRWTPVQTRGGNREVQLSEFHLYNGQTALLTPTITNPGGSTCCGETPDKLVDTVLTTKWLDYSGQGLLFDFGTPSTVNGYRMATAGDASGRDPVSWDLEGSDDLLNWFPLDSRRGATTYLPTARNTWADLISFSEPFAITRTEYNRATGIVTLEWVSTPGATYAIEYSDDLGLADWWFPIEGGIPAAAGSRTTHSFFLFFPNPPFALFRIVR